MIAEEKNICGKLIFGININSIELFLRASSTRHGTRETYLRDIYYVLFVGYIKIEMAYC